VGYFRRQQAAFHVSAGRSFVGETIFTCHSVFMERYLV
jgi:hypothetical protein